MKKALLLLSLIFPCLLFAQTEPANYKEAVKQFADFYNKGDADDLFAMFNTKMKAAVPLDKTKFTLNQLKSQLGEIAKTEFESGNPMVSIYKTTFTNGIFALRLALDAENKITGFFVQPYTKQEKTLPIDASLTETHLSVTVTDATLSGSIITPKNSIGKIPVVLIIAGSGPTDRNGNNTLGVTANSYFLLADALGKAGIATLRYDKRGIGKSTTTKIEANTRFDDFVNDAIGLIKQLKADSRFSEVIVLGHSEGSLIGMIAAEREKVDGYISLSGAGDKASKVIAEQYKVGSPKSFLVSKAKLDSLDKGLKVSENNDPMFRSAA